MRELKFRQYIEETTVANTKLDAHFNYWGYIDGQWKMPLADRDSDQYTGLKDSNGVEIYESDIVKFRTTRLHNKKRTESEKPRAKWFTSPVEWEDFWPGFVISETQPQDNPLWVDKDNKLHVIGNIHENSELLK